MSLQNKLNRFKKQLTHVGSEGRLIQQDEQNNMEIENKENPWSRLEATRTDFEDQHCIIRERQFDRSKKIGPYRVDDLYNVVDKWHEWKGAHPLSASGRSPSDLLFFDTETTGLGTGAGNTIFMLGVGKVLDHTIQVRQYFLPGPGHEVALYHHFLTDVQDMSNLVTYNGKAFDWPQVKTRHTFVRDMVPKLPPFGHFDLLHASRRVWKKSYESLRLSVVEEELLQIERHEDTPGYLAPMLYFEYLREKDPEVLKGVFEHNEQDILTLMALYIHLSYILMDTDYSSLTVTERFEVAKWFESLGDHPEALSRFEQLEDTSYSFQAKKAIADLHKKAKNMEMAVDYWTAALKEKDDAEIYIELAKVFEHRHKDFEQALYFAEKGYQAWKETSRILRKDEKKDRVAYQKRIERLEGKIS
ncbi:ribonuclease H-like domain-containing protein [Pseudalkalibacillus sp. SCS-8]|uniref:ribonuclease H-like domain-containing protein n=1 Tax=Pseudalkalibacillus nanhaiensis TaxID=3115291 RepID=UPI0032D9AF23